MGCTSRASAGKGEASGGSKATNSFPELNGSQKQIEWATNIRENVDSNIDSIIDNETRIGERSDGTIVRKEITPEIQTTIDTANDVRDVLKDRLRNETSASRIIDARNDLSYDSLKSLIKEQSTGRMKLKKEGKEQAMLEAVKKRGIQAKTVKEAYKKALAVRISTLK